MTTSRDDFSDLIERAQNALAGRTPGDRIVPAFTFWSRLVRALVDALEAARGQRDEDLADFAKNYAHLTTQNERLRDEFETYVRYAEQEIEELHSRSAS